MNTPAHLLVGAAAFGRPGSMRITRYAFIGAVLPDTSLYLLAGAALFVLQIPPERVFDELYFSDTWQTIFAIDNSFVLWGLFLAVAIWRKWAGAIALCGAALLHLALDFPLHHDDARAHFFPLTRWVFESPLSYWDSNHHASIIAPLEAVLACAALIVLWRRFRGWRMRSFSLLLIAAEFWVIRQWLLFF